MTMLILWLYISHCFPVILLYFSALSAVTEYRLGLKFDPLWAITLITFRVLGDNFYYYVKLFYVLSKLRIWIQICPNLTFLGGWIQIIRHGSGSKIPKKCVAIGICKDV